MGKVQTIAYETDKNPMSEESLWDRRYRLEGRMWGSDPSPAAIVMSQRIREIDRPSIVEIGSGYGRDGKYFTEQGYNYTGIERSPWGLIVATEDVRHMLDAGRLHILTGTFSTASFPRDSYDGFFSHRTLHLLGKNGLVAAFNNKAAKWLKPGGLLVVSARDPRDFNDDDMIATRTEDGVVKEAEYRRRPGHFVTFWDEERYTNTFGGDFNIVEFIQGKELESESNPKDTYFTIMVAKKKPPEPPVQPVPGAAAVFPSLAPSP